MYYHNDLGDREPRLQLRLQPIEFSRRFQGGVVNLNAAQGKDNRINSEKLSPA